LNGGAFINCPFDADYRECFEAILFSCYACGVAPRTALQDRADGVLRFERLAVLVDHCEFGVHDLSRIEPDTLGRPRFNMPFELGFFLGAKHFGGRRQRTKRTLVLVRDKHVLGAYLSDLAGIDPMAHGGSAENVISAVRDFFRRAAAQRRSALGTKSPSPKIPGPSHIIALFRAFNDELPRIAREEGFKLAHFNALDAHVDYCLAVESFLTTPQTGRMTRRQNPGQGKPRK
jgi:hypothetical protein